MLTTSRLYSFIDHKNGYTLHFFEGQKLISELATLHNLSPKSFLFYRDLILTNQLLIAYLKPTEFFNVYIDSSNPEFKFKIEMDFEGNMRSLLFPTSFNSFPALLNGQCRLVKYTVSTHNSYTSTIPLLDTPFSEVTNKVITDSYQFKSKTILSETSDQSVLISRLPQLNVNKIEDTKPISLDDYHSAHQKGIDYLFENAIDNYETIQKTLENENLVFIGSKDIAFKCNCNAERFINGIKSLILSSGIDAIFDHENSDIEIKCDYCNKLYYFNKNQFN